MECWLRRPSVRGIKLNTQQSLLHHNIAYDMRILEHKNFFPPTSFLGKKQLFWRFWKKLRRGLIFKKGLRWTLDTLGKVYIYSGLEISKGILMIRQFFILIFHFFVKSAFSEINFIVTHRHYIWTQWQTVVICMSKHVT